MISVQVDHSADFGDARDQGLRPTCLAFAASDGHSHWRPAPVALLSPEFLFFEAAKRWRPRNHFDGVGIDAVAAALMEKGQPLEVHYPYNAKLNQKATLPSPPDPFPHDLYRGTCIHESFSEVKAARLLNEGTSILLALRITASFLTITPGQEVLKENSDQDAIVGIHAVVGVGYGKKESGESFLRIRNSWGKGWAMNGYLWLPTTYAAKHALWMARFE